MKDDPDHSRNWKACRSRTVILSCFLWWIALQLPSLGLEKPDRAEKLFGLTNLWEAHITLSSVDWQNIQSVPPRRSELRQSRFPWGTAKLECAGETLTNVAIRCKGNSSFQSSRGSLKHPFKLDFNRGYKGRDFFGLKELSLNNNFNDATQFREVLAYQACRESGLPTPRTAFARVYLTVPGLGTNVYLGLYTLVEPVDESFLKRHFASAKGLLLKPEGVRSLEYFGDSWNAYTNRYIPKTSADADAENRFIELTRLLAQASEGDLAVQLPQQLDIDLFLRYLATTSYLANYDSFLGNGHNYYLFQPKTKGKATFIPWDFNEAFGGHPMAGSREDQTQLSVLRPAAPGNRLIDSVIANKTWAQQYRNVLQNLATNLCTPERLIQRANELSHLVQSAVFDESPAAKAAFEKVALGVTPGKLSSFGRGLPGRPESTPLNDWIIRRTQNVREELSGERIGQTPRMQGFPGRRGGPPPGGILDFLRPRGERPPP